MVYIDSGERSTASGNMRLSVNEKTSIPPAWAKHCSWDWKKMKSASCSLMRRSCPMGRTPTPISMRCLPIFEYAKSAAGPLTIRKRKKQSTVSPPRFMIIEAKSSPRYPPAGSSPNDPGPGRCPVVVRCAMTSIRWDTSERNPEAEKTAPAWRRFPSKHLLKRYTLQHADFGAFRRSSAFSRSGGFSSSYTACRLQDIGKPRSVRSATDDLALPLIQCVLRF